LAAVTELLEYLPDKIGMAVVVIQHLDPKHGSLTVEILARSTPMPVAEVPVAEVKEGMRIEGGHVYVIPPNRSLEISGDVFKLSPRLEGRGRHLPIDL
jgi:two-component system CheB/CheR fusion protein